jgi:hypothetical protein
MMTCQQQQDIALLLRRAERTLGEISDGLSFWRLAGPWCVWYLPHIPPQLGEVNRPAANDHA